MPGEIEVEFNKKGTEIKKIIRPNKEENKKKYNRYYV